MPAETIECPHCHNKSARAPVRRLSPDRNPAVREQVRDLSCFAWVCPVCGKRSLVVEPCLYHDIAGQFMVWLLPDGSTPEGADFDPLSGYTLRYVESPNDFREKIALLERGLDDRAVELMKLLLYMQLNRSFDIVELLFHEYHERTGAFTFVAVLADGAEQYVDMQGETYRRLAQDVEERLFTPSRTFLKIDIAWAKQALELLKA